MGETGVIPLCGGCYHGSAARPAPQCSEPIQPPVSGEFVGSEF